MKYLEVTSQNTACFGLAHPPGQLYQLDIIQITLDHSSQAQFIVAVSVKYSNACWDQQQSQLQRQRQRSYKISGRGYPFYVWLSVSGYPYHQRLPTVHMPPNGSTISVLHELQPQADTLTRLSFQTSCALFTAAHPAHAAFNCDDCVAGARAHFLHALHLCSSRPMRCTLGLAFLLLPSARLQFVRAGALNVLPQETIVPQCTTITRPWSQAPPIFTCVSNR
ncbi:hypothetical protein C8R47DRAFT_1146330 [Mycena vitilis]|nr:hypothetical protein C8R47DRAFT_1146330 [Mycena vitilis]